MSYWLVKSEGDCYSIDDFKNDRRTSWTGIRNFQARNFMRDGMKIGDGVLFYHSNSNPNGVYGVAQVVSKPHIDETSVDPKDEHYDSRAADYKLKGKEPLWMCVDMAFVEKLSKPVSLEAIKNDSELKSMLVAKRGQRLSVMPVEEKHFMRVMSLGQK
ncbi:MAG: EVE domain-containing protein [bacterium]|nr:EVE domain-containing protein [bacterium]